MRRIAGTIGIASVLALGAPAVASAQHHHRHHHRHHHQRIRFERFGAIAGAAVPGSTAGTVASFENGVLTLTLNDGSSVKGTVTPATEIKCEVREPAAHVSDHGQGSGDNQGGERSGRDNNEEANENEHAQEAENENEELPVGAPACGPSSLVKGAMVRAAELKITPFGTFFEEVELVA